MWVIVEKAPPPACDFASSRSQGIAFLDGASARADRANDAAAILALPGGTGEVTSHDLAAGVEQLGLRGVEGPDKGGGLRLGRAGVDLDPTRPELEEEDGAGWRHQFGGNLLARAGLSLAVTSPARLTIRARVAKSVSNLATRITVSSCQRTGSDPAALSINGVRCPPATPRELAGHPYRPGVNRTGHPPIGVDRPRRGVALR